MRASLACDSVVTVGRFASGCIIVWLTGSLHQNYIADQLKHRPMICIDAVRVLMARDDAT